MNVTNKPFNTWSLSILLLLTSSFCIAQETTEKATLTAIVRQLDLMQTMLSQTETYAAQTNNSRYHFDYQRLYKDLAKVRSGINDYITPKRAQPRDPIELVGNYQNERE